METKLYLSIKAISPLSYTSFRAHTGYVGHYVWQYGELGLNNTPDHELAWNKQTDKEISKYFRKYLKFSNPQFASNEVVKTT